MRQQTSSRPRRGRNSGRRPGPQRNQNFDSNGPSVRVRGNAYQVMEKYLTLARDATTSGDRIAAENYYQHAEHYFRILNANNEASAASNANANANGGGGGQDNAEKANGQHRGRPDESGSGERRPEQRKADQARTGEAKPADAPPAGAPSIDAPSIDAKAPIAQPDEGKPAKAEAANARSDEGKARPASSEPATAKPATAKAAKAAKAEDTGGADKKPGKGTEPPLAE
ncbi:MAG: DUF4167 domain-containing protein [Alphaproteobacteria bacterium]